MRRTITVLVVLLGLVLGAEAFSAKVIGITDRDTLTILRDGRPEVVRLNGIDAPERGQPFRTRAKQLAADLAFGQRVEVIVRDQDRYGRTIADVWQPDERSPNHELVRAGVAWWFRRYSTDVTLAAAEAEGRAVRRGLWTDAHSVVA